MPGSSHRCRLARSMANPPPWWGSFRTTSPRCWSHDLCSTTDPPKRSSSWSTESMTKKVAFPGTNIGKVRAAREVSLWSMVQRERCWRFALNGPYSQNHILCLMFKYDSTLLLSKMIEESKFFAQTLHGECGWGGYRHLRYWSWYGILWSREWSEGGHTLSSWQEMNLAWACHVCTVCGSKAKGSLQINIQAMVSNLYF